MWLFGILNEGDSLAFDTPARMAATSTLATTWHPIRNDKGPDILEVLGEKKPTTPRPSA
jgi:hypothetical protein